MEDGAGLWPLAVGIGERISRLLMVVFVFHTHGQAHLEGCAGFLIHGDGTSIKPTPPPRMAKATVRSQPDLGQPVPGTKGISAPASCMQNSRKRWPRQSS